LATHIFPQYLVVLSAAPFAIVVLLAVRFPAAVANFGYVGLCALGKLVGARATRLAKKVM
jgi:hypothetical protein